MKHGALVKACAVCGLVTAVSGLGCAHRMSSESTRIRQATWQADLDDCREVRLSVSRVHERTEGEPERRYEELTLEVRPRPDLEFESVLKRVELQAGVPRERLSFGEIEVRTDESRRRVWFVDRQAGRVIATLDRETGVTTGPDDERPGWATVNGGIPLEARE